MGLYPLDMQFIIPTKSIKSKKIIAIAILNAGNLAWYFVIRNQFETLFQVSSGDKTWIYVGSALFYFFAAVSAIIGCALTSKVNHKKFLWSWVTFGVITQGCLILFKGEIVSLIFGPLLGISLGVGFPYSLKLLSDCTAIEERGRISGIYLLLSFIMIASAMVTKIALELGLIGIIIVLMIIKSTGFLALIISDCVVSTEVNYKKRIESWFSVLRKRNLILYLIPWLMFLIVAVLTDHLVWADIQKNADYEMVMEVTRPLNYAGTAIFGLISGIITDRLGRKYPIVAGLVILGISSIFLGIVPSKISVFIHMITMGAAFGFLMVTYTVVPGDIASNSKEKIYALIAVIPLTIYGGIGAIPRALDLTASATILSPILSVILFLSILPVLQAQETLPKKIINERKIKEHMKKVGELMENEKNE